MCVYMYTVSVEAIKLPAAGIILIIVCIRYRGSLSCFSTNYYQQVIFSFSISGNKNKSIIQSHLTHLFLSVITRNLFHPNITRRRDSDLRPRALHATDSSDEREREKEGIHSYGRDYVSDWI